VVVAIAVVVAVAIAVAVVIHASTVDVVGKVVRVARNRRCAGVHYFVVVLSTVRRAAVVKKIGVRDTRDATHVGSSAHIRARVGSLRK